MSFPVLRFKVNDSFDCTRAPGSGQYILLNVRVCTQSHTQEKIQNSFPVLLPPTMTMQPSVRRSIALSSCSDTEICILPACAGMQAACVGTCTQLSRPKEWLSLNENDHRGFLVSHHTNVFSMILGLWDYLPSSLRIFERINTLQSPTR